MLRHLLVTGFLVSAGSAFSQSIFAPNTQPEYPTSILWDSRGSYKTVFDTFADSTVNKVLVEPVEPFLWTPTWPKEQPGAKEHIGPDGKPGIPLPPLHEPEENEVYIWRPCDPEKK